MSAPAAELAPDPTPDPTTPEPGPPVWHRHRWVRNLLRVAAVVALVAGVVAAGGTLLVRRFDHAVSRAELLDPAARVGPPPPGAAHQPISGPLNVLLLGSDYRLEDPTMGQRSDTIIIAHVSAAMNHVFLISIPRDLRVWIPAQGDFPGYRDKVNAAFQYGHGGTGGAQLVSTALSELTGIRFDGAASVDFAGMVHVVDLLGGVRLCVDTPVVSIHTNRAFEIGCPVMSSDVVLDYLRQRNFPDGDFSRQRHQQQFVKAVLDQVATAKVLANPVRLDNLLQSIAASMTVDLGPMALTDLVFALSGLGTDSLTGLRIPYDLQMIGDVSYVVATDEAESLWSALRTDTLAEWAAAHPEWVNTI
jgi:LCP family protein required for cell wall assembly